ncbi:hypothetical protein JIN85_18240 [Luteolibacter pohnpeiensis]|uniref:Uncharacterized protein n=1 Tax=Luteolibacter pohnpeiensis TaxID=454153 RepID=A0A934VXZ4_9BACT|nr:hypothetical protein [Luteolibacter pohnpeiensis]MBK1884363.1 hypothetical protein [Luteolibacter pohnpeiensis]
MLDSSVTKVAPIRAENSAEFFPAPSLFLGTRINELKTPTATRFFTPIEELYPHSQNRDECRALSDPDFTVLGSLRCINLRNHHLSYIDSSRPADGQKKEHDATIIQRATVESLRYQARKGEKVIYFWDKACIDYATWEKSNSAMKTLSIERHNRKDPCNEGILSDTLVGNSNDEALAASSTAILVMKEFTPI